MKRIYSVILASIVTASACAQSINESKPKLSPLTKQYLHDIKSKTNSDKVPEGYIYKRHADGVVYVCALIKVVNATIVQQSLTNIGAKVGTKAGNIWTVQLPFNRAEDFINIQGISYIQIDEPVYPDLDFARTTTRVDSVHRGINLPMHYSGKDVIMGVIDFGFDYNHPTFYDTLHANYRIKRVWELNGTGTPPSGYSYGNEITDTTLIKAQGTDNAAQMHGTATAGIAAGSGFGSTTNKRFRGMAYDADLVLVGVRRDSIEQQWQQGSFTDFLDGINYIFSYATSVGRPAVVNISWGSQSGPHDGSTLFNQACNNLTGPGKIVVMSAGNEGTEKIHLSKSFTPADTTISTFLTFSSQLYKRTWVEVWGDSGKTFCGKVSLFSNNLAGSTTNYICIDDSTYNQELIGVNGLDTCYVKFINSSAEFNNKPRMTIDIYSKASDSIGITFSGTDGNIHLWNEYYYYGYTNNYQSAFDSLKQTWAVSGNTQSTISDIGSGDSVLLIGAYASKTNFTDINGNSWSYSGYVQTGKLVPFSSRGPMTDGRVKPDITAPGLTLATSVSSYDADYTPTGASSQLVIAGYLDPGTSTTYYYAEISGTSASAPCASGIVALMLQANPNLGPKEVKDIIIATAIKDANTGVIPPGGNNNWGNGKINAYGALKTLTTFAGIYSYSGEKLDCTLYPNPNNGLFTIDFSGDRKRNLQIDVYNMSGLKVTSELWNVNAGINLKQLDLSNISSGVYLVKVSSENGQVLIKSLVK